MNRRIRRLPLGVTLLALLTVLGCGSGPPRVVILIVIDTMRADRLGSYGHERDTSPQIDRLAKDAVRFEEALAQAPWTTPSIGSLLTSRYPSSLGIDRFASRLPDDATLLSESLQGAGYATGAVVSHTFCSSRWGFDRGFDQFDESSIAGQRGVTSEKVTDRALEFVAGHADAPFFLLVHYFDPHFALVEHDGFRFSDEAGGEPYAGNVRSPVPFLNFGRVGAELGPADAREMLRIYDSEVAFTDHHVGRLLDDLRRRGLYDDALVVLTADHGEEFLDHGRIGHTKTLYRELLRVPLLLKLPGNAARVEPRAVGLIDVAPTIVEIVGLDPSPAHRGQSLLDPADPARPVFAETSRQASLRAVVSGDWKLISDPGRHNVKLFRRSSDPEERVDLGRQRRQERNQLVSLLQTFAVLAERREPMAPPVELSDDDRRRLESLGYGE